MARCRGVMIPRPHWARVIARPRHIRPGACVHSRAIRAWSSTPRAEAGVAGGDSESEGACEWEARGCAWAALDPNPRTRDEVLDMVGRGDTAALQKALGARLAFGTAGIRGPMAAGSAAMNDLTVLQTAQGLAVYLEDVFGEDELRRRGVAVGYDHRATQDGALFSEQFALLTAAVLAHRGVCTFLYSELVATPLVPWAVEQKGCCAGVMVTASHNPKEDNGYKVYWENGAQIIAPHDSGIAAAIERSTTPWAEYSPRTIRASPLVVDETEALAQGYLRTAAARLCHNGQSTNPSASPVVYTAMHGVGAEWVRRMFEGFGLKAYVGVAEQNAPDPMFPTVAYPNPEEGEGALALAMATATREGATLVLANDPDADRLAVAELAALDADGADVEGGEQAWRVFNGNEIGLLLGHWQWTKFREQHPEHDVPAQRVTMLASAVSSKALAALARAEGFMFEETLTGFKWMGNRTHDLRTEGGAEQHVIFAFEEAIGFCVGDVVKDKDGVCAAAVFAEMAAELKAVHGRSVSAQLAHLGETYGHFVSCNGYEMAPDPAAGAALFQAMRTARDDGAGYGVGAAIGAEQEGRWPITAVRDLHVGYDSSCEGGRATLPRENMLTYTLGLEGAGGCADAVVTLRASGTEPKLKYYVEVAGRPGGARTAAEREASNIARVVVEQILRPGLEGKPPPLF